MQTLQRACLMALAVVGLALTGAVPADARDQAGTITRFGAGGGVSHPAIDSDSRGRGTATWLWERKAWSSDFDGRSWSCPKALPGSAGAVSFYDASWNLAEAASGAAVLSGAVRDAGGRTRAAVWTRAAVGRPWVQVRWSDPNSFAVTQAAGIPSVALTGSVALVAWVAQDRATSEVYAAKIPVGSTAKVTPTSVYSRSGPPTDTDPDVGIDAQGNALIQFEDWVGYDYLLYLTRWPSGGVPATAIVTSEVEYKSNLTSMHVNAAGQMITSWGYAPSGPGAPAEYQQWVGLGTSVAGITSQDIWQRFGTPEAVYEPDTVGSDIDAAGNASLMVIYDNQLYGGLGNVNSGLGALAPRASKPVAHGGDRWDVTVRGGRAIAALSTTDGASILEELVGDQFTTAATLPGSTAVDSAFVSTGGMMRPAMVGTSAVSSFFRTTLPTRVRRC